MFWPSRLKILVCIQVFFRLCYAIVSNEEIFKSMSFEERKSFFGTEDASIPECQVVELIRPLRSKRSDKEPLNITFNFFGTSSTATLYVVEDDDLVSPRRTGVWTAHYRPTVHQNVRYNPWPQVFDTMRDIQFLQNVKEGSAVTRSWDQYGNENIVGVLRQNYTVKPVPNGFKNSFINIIWKHGRRGRSVNSMNNQDKKRLLLTICKDDGVLQEYFRRHSYAKNDARSNPNLPRPKRQRTNPIQLPDVVYPKLLVIPDFRTVKHYTHKRDFMVQLIAQLNCIDMMFRQLKNPEVHLNVAGIIIPENNGTTPYISKHIDNNNRIDSNAAVQAAKIYFSNEVRRFPSVKWESMLMLTTYPIISDNVEGPLMTNGSRSTAQGCSQAAAIATFTEKMGGIYTLANVLGRMFSEKDNQDEGVVGQCNTDEGYLMVPDRDYSGRLEWSSCRLAAFQSYFKSNAENCAYKQLVKISDKVEGMPGAWMPLDGQCDNKFNDSTSSCMKRSKGIPDCSRYGCKRNNTCHWISSPPLQGSLFYQHKILRACINQTVVIV